MIQKLNVNDIDAIYEVEKASFKKPWEKSVIEGTVKQKSYCFFGVFNDDEICGYSSLTIVAGECYVNRIAVKNEHRKKGYASELFSAMIDYCIEKNAEFISLEVRVSNTPAINLYKKFGLEAVGERRNFYDDPVENAAIMTRFFKTQN